MLGRKVRCPVVELVIFDHDQAGDKGEGAGAVENGVDIGAEFFLLGRVGGLEDEDALRDEEDAGRVQKLFIVIVWSV